MNTSEYINKSFRIQIRDSEVQYLHCLPAINDQHTESQIPKNEIVKIVDFYIMYNANWFVVEYAKKRFLVTEAQVKDYFIPIMIRSDGRNRRKC